MAWAISPPTDYVQDSGLPLLHFVLVHERGELPPVELHWRVHWYEQRFARERLLPPTAGQEGQWRPAPADELTSLLLFYARDGFIDLRLATDLGAWWDVHGPDLDPGALDEVLACLSTAHAGDPSCSHGGRTNRRLAHYPDHRDDVTARSS